MKNADIVNVLRLLSDVSGENIVAGDEVSGSISIKLNNVLGPSAGYYSEHQRVWSHQDQQHYSGR